MPQAAIWLAGSSRSTASRERLRTSRLPEECECLPGASERLVTAATALPMIRAATIPIAIALRYGPRVRPIMHWNASGPRSLQSPNRDRYGIPAIAPAIAPPNPAATAVPRFIRPTPFRSLVLVGFIDRRTRSAHLSGGARTVVQRTQMDERL